MCGGRHEKIVTTESNDEIQSDILWSLNRKLRRWDQLSFFQSNNKWKEEEQQQQQIERTREKQEDDDEEILFIVNQSHPISSELFKQ